MKAQTPALNIIVSLIYISLAGASMFLLKLASKPRLLPPSSQQPSKQQQTAKVYRRMAVSWLKKYSILGAGMHADRKYLAKELLILSVYGVACLKINKITLWPVALIAFLLPSIFFVYEIALKLQRKGQSTSQQKTVNEVQIAVQSENLEAAKVVSTQQTVPKITKQIRNALEIGAISSIAFIAVVLDFQAVMVLDKSVSNSGELNLISVLCIVLLDQLILRPLSGLLFILTIKFLEYRQMLSIYDNTLVIFLCEQQLLAQQLLQEQRRARAALESTQNHLQPKEEEQLHDTNVPIKPDHATMAYIDFQHIQPEAKQQISSPHQAFNHSSKEIIDQVQIYLTTPQKELFQVDIFSNNNETIVNTYLCNKQNAQNLSNTSQITYQPNHKQEINCFEELILTKNHDPLRNIQNLEPSFKNQTEMEEQKKKAQNKRKNKRVLKLTGNSPYLQYLPNMLKNVRKAQTLGVAETPKLAQLNFR